MTKTGNEKWWLVPWRVTFCAFVIFAIVDLVARAVFSTVSAAAFFVDVFFALPELALVYVFAKKDKAKAGRLGERNKTNVPTSSQENQ